MRKISNRAVILSVVFVIILYQNFIGIRPAYCDANTGEVKTIFIKGGESFDLVYIPAGSFMMGSDLSDADRSPSEWPRHKVEISRGFWMMKNEVTQDQWESVMNSNPSYFKNDAGAGREDSPLDNPGGDTQKYHSGRDSCPVERASWNDCEKFITALNSKEVGIFRLPSEAEWEYACRAGSDTAFYWGDALDDKYLWYMNNAYNKPQMVCQKLPNAWGLFDMSGNICEWCADWNEPVRERTGAEALDPKGPRMGDYKIVRGGSWAVNSNNSRSAGRSMQKPADGDMYTGFRLIWEPAVASK